jgi:hypothetical protein
MQARGLDPWSSANATLPASKFADGALPMAASFCSDALPECSQKWSM